MYPLALALLYCGRCDGDRSFGIIVQMYEIFNQNKTYYLFYYFKILSNPLRSLNLPKLEHLNAPLSLGDSIYATGAYKFVVVGKSVKMWPCSHVYLASLTPSYNK